MLSSIIVICSKDKTIADDHMSAFLIPTNKKKGIEDMFVLIITSKRLSYLIGKIPRQILSSSQQKANI